MIEILTTILAPDHNLSGKVCCSTKGANWIKSDTWTHPISIPAGWSKYEYSSFDLIRHNSSRIMVSLVFAYYFDLEYRRLI